MVTPFWLGSPSMMTRRRLGINKALGIDQAEARDICERAAEIDMHRSVVQRCECSAGWVPELLED
jgi:hypothetical protein